MDFDGFRMLDLDGFLGLDSTVLRIGFGFLSGLGSYWFFSGLDLGFDTGFLFGFLGFGSFSFADTKM